MATSQSLNAFQEVFVDLAWSVSFRLGAQLSLVLARWLDLVDLCRRGLVASIKIASVPLILSRARPDIAVSRVPAIFGDSAFRGLGIAERDAN
jgi:hypothetical protein